MPTVQNVTPRKQPKQKRAQATTEAILEAAAHILVQEGIEAASTNRIAERAGVSVGSLYQYFPSKSAVIFALVERHVQRMQTQLEEMAIALADAPVEEAVPIYVGAMLAVHRVETKLHRVFMEELPRLAGREVLQRWSESMESVVRAYLETHRGRLRPTDLDLAAFTLVHAVEAVTRAVTVLRPRYFERAALADEISHLVLRYLVDAPPKVKR